MRRALFPALCLVLMPVAQAAGFRLCTADQPFYPLTLPDGRGQHQFLLRQALRELGQSLENYVAPRLRCLQDLRSGQADGALGVFSAERLDYAVYPMKGEGADPQYGLGPVRFMVYRRSGSAVRWDGRSFEGLGEGAIGVQFGFSYGTKLKLQSLRVDDKALSAEQLLSKLDKGRNPAVVLQQAEAQRVIAQLFAGRIEQIETPFDEYTLYLMLSKRFQARDPVLAKQLWLAIAKVRESTAYKQYRPPLPSPPPASVKQ